MCEMIIEKPWEESACDECIHCKGEDMCSAYRIGMSFAYCPAIRNCEKFHRAYRVIRLNTVDKVFNDLKK